MDPDRKVREAFLQRAHMDPLFLVDGHRLAQFVVAQGSDYLKDRRLIEFDLQTPRHEILQLAEVKGSPALTQQLSGFFLRQSLVQPACAGLLKSYRPRFL